MTALVDFASLERPASPNTYLLAPQGLCRQAEPDAASPVFNLAPADLFARVQALVSETPYWSVEASDAAGLQLETIARTKVLKFKDDVSIRALSVPDDPQKSQIAVYSRSRVGYHDFGANKKRVEGLVAELKEKA